MSQITIPVPALQIDFSFALGQMRTLYLQDALRETISGIDIARVDRELSLYVPATGLQSLAKHGLRGELAFPVPCLLEANPRLLGYYRLLLGFSQKEFYTTRFGVSGFKAMESRGVLTQAHRSRLPDLCRALIASSEALVQGIGTDRVSAEVLDDLSLLTLGPQLRGGANVKKGVEGIVAVFRVIHDIVQPSVSTASETKIEIINAAGRDVVIQFAPDPDIVITQKLTRDRSRNILAIEVKGGTDFSNIHNRVGEAEKSHQKAKAAGFVECWTVVNVDRIDLAMAQRESPTTNRFFRLSDLMNAEGNSYDDFKDRVLSLIGM